MAAPRRNVLRQVRAATEGRPLQIRTPLFLEFLTLARHIELAFHIPAKLMKTLGVTNFGQTCYTLGRVFVDRG